MMVTIDQILEHLSRFLELIAAAIIAVGFLHGIGIFVASLLRMGPPISIEAIRMKLVTVTILSIEFLLAADLIYTVIAPTYYEIGILASLVAIRTILTYFLNQEFALLSAKRH